MSSEANGEIPNAEVAALKLSDSPQPNGGGDATNNESDSPPSFEECFKAFSKFGDTKSDGKLITLSQSDKWMKQAKVIDGKKITTTDSGIYFKKLKSLKVGVVDYQKFLQDLAASKKLEVEDVKKKLSTCGPPGFTSVRSVKSAGAAVDRLTDTSKYTGSHKQRFDQSGKGRGIAGRKDEVDTSGYVSGYKDKNTFGKK